MPPAGQKQAVPPPASLPLDTLPSLLFFLLAAILATPLLVSSQFFFPFIFTKFLYFRTLVVAAFFVWTLVAWRDARYRPRRSILATALLVYGGIVLIASLAGVNVSKSFWGTVERGDGLFTLAHVFLFFFMLSSAVKTRVEWRTFLSVSVFVSFLASLYALGQLLGVRGVLITTGARVASTIGNPAFFAAYLLFNIFFAGILLIGTADMRWKAALSLLIAFEVAMLFATETRGAILALFGGVVVMGTLFFFYAPARALRRASLAFLLFFIASAIVVFLFRSSLFVSRVPGINRLVSISRDDITTRNRLLVWRASWESWRERFFLGYGYENYDIALNAHFPPRIYDDRGSQIWFDRAHNIILDTGLTSGILGLIAYLSIFVAAFVSIWRFARRERERLSAAVIAAAALAVYFAQNFFVFDTTSSFLMFMTLLAYCEFLGRRGSSNSPMPADQRRGRERQPAPPPLVAISLIVSVALAYGLTLRFIPSNKHIAFALGLQKAGRLEGALAEFKSGLDGAGYQKEEFRQKFAEFLIRSGRQLPNDAFQQASAFLEGELGNSISAAPLGVRNYLSLMALDNATYQFDAARLDRALSLGKKAIPLSPTRPHIYSAMGQAYLAQGRIALAKEGKAEAMRLFSRGIKQFQKALVLQDKVVDSRWQLAAAYIVAGRDAEAKEEFRVLEERFGFVYDSVGNLQRLLAIYVPLRRYSKAAELTKKLIELEPTNVRHYAQLAGLLACLGDTEGAVEQAKQAVAHDSAIASQVQKFIKNPRCLVR